MMYCLCQQTVLTVDVSDVLDEQSSQAVRGSLSLVCHWGLLGLLEDHDLSRIRVILQP